MQYGYRKDERYEYMDIREMEKRLGDIYDLNKAEDCQKVIQVLLRDIQRRCEETCQDNLKVLVEAVLTDNPRAKEIAQKIETGIRPRTAEQLVGFLTRMSNDMGRVEQLSRDELVDEVIKVWSRFLMDSWESAVLDEMIQRFKKARSFVDESVGWKGE